MNYLIDFIFGNLLAHFISSGATEIVIKAIIGIILILLLKWILSLSKVFLLANSQKDHVLDYSLRCRLLDAYIYLFLCFLISVNIVLAWKLYWLTGVIDFIPLWIVFLFSGIMAIIVTGPIRSRLNQLKNIEKKLRNAS